VQDALERAEGTVLQRLHCAHRLAHDAGGLGGREVLEEPKDQNLLLLVGQGS